MILSRDFTRDKDPNDFLEMSEFLWLCNTRKQSFSLNPYTLNTGWRQILAYLAFCRPGGFWNSAGFTADDSVENFKCLFRLLAKARVCVCVSDFPVPQPTKLWT